MTPEEEITRLKVPKSMEKDLEEISVPAEKAKNTIVLMSKFSPVPYAKYLMTHFNFLNDKYKRFWRYDKRQGIWREDAEEFIKSQLRNTLLGEEQQKNNYVSEIVNYIRDKNYNPDFEGTLAENMIAFQNCLYDIDADQFVDFSPEYFVTAKIPVEIDPSDSPECSVIDAFFEDIIGPEYKIILYEICAYCLYRSYPYQKIFFLIGAGKNGKTTFLELLRMFLGNDNVASASPHDICGGDKFSLGMMWNKLANISSDISYEVLKEVNKIKELTGGDTVSVRRMYKDPFPARLYAKQIFSTNQLPIVNDKTNAWYRRPYLIEFPNSFTNPDRTILSKLTTKAQLSGLAWQCIKCLKDMKARGFCFTYDIDECKIATMYEDLSNPLSKFIRERCDEDEGDPDAYIWKFEFRKEFESWLKANKFRIWTETELGVEMKRRFGEKQRMYPLSGNPAKIYRTWEGLKWKKQPNSQGSQTSHHFKTSSLYIKVELQTPVKSAKPVSSLNNKESGEADHDTQ